MTQEAMSQVGAIVQIEDNFVVIEFHVGQDDAIARLGAHAVRQ